MRIGSVLKGPRRVRRIAHIARKGTAHGLGFLVGRLDLPRHLPAWVRLPRPGPRAHPEDLPARLASLLEELGPTFVKFGQMLATRPDLLPPQYIHELERICHRVAPFSGAVSRAIVEGELGRPASSLFREFSEQPRASGSIAQVHDAVLADGTPVVVKVRRPRIEQVIEDDLAILAFLAGQAAHLEELRPLRLPMIVEEFGRSIRRELDFLTEAAHTHRFREAFADDERIHVPAVYWDYTTERVLTMERVEGRHLAELLNARDADVDRRWLARAVMDAYLKQLFTLGFFHADPHPGNIVLTSSGRIGLLDFGMVGRISGRLRRQLSACLIAMGNRQVELVAEILGEIGRLPDDERAEEFQEEVVALLERYSAVPVERLNMQRSFLDIMAVIRRYGVAVPRDFVLMGRALVVVGGIVTQLDPALNVGALAAPYGRRLIAQRLTAEGLRADLMSGGYHLGNLLADGPRTARRLVQRLQRGLFEFTVRHEGFEKALRELDQTGNRLSLSVILAAIIMASAGLLSANVGPVNILGGRVSLPGLVGMAFGFILGVWLIVGIIRSRRL